MANIIKHTRLSPTHFRPPTNHQTHPPTNQKYILLQFARNAFRCRPISILYPNPDLCEAARNLRRAPQSHQTTRVGLTENAPQTNYLSLNRFSRELNRLYMLYIYIYIFEALKSVLCALSAPPT